MGVQEEVSEKLEEQVDDIRISEIILFDDDVNTFDHVIETLIDTCEHTPIQAEQCALLVHYKGKCAVKSGTYEELVPRCSKLLQAGLSAEII